MPSIFISYRRADSRADTYLIYEFLAAEFGDNDIFLDVEPDNIPAGEDFRQILRSAVNGCNVLLVIIGPQWLDIRETDNPNLRRLDNPDDWVRIEVETGLSLRERGLATVIPVLVGDAKMPSAKQLPETLRPLSILHARQIRGLPDFEHDFKKLVDRIYEILPEETQTDVSVPSPGIKTLLSAFIVLFLSMTAIILVIISNISGVFINQPTVTPNLQTEAALLVTHRYQTLQATLQPLINTPNLTLTLDELIRQIEGTENANKTATVMAYTPTPTYTASISPSPTENSTAIAQTKALETSSAMTNIADQNQTETAQAVTQIAQLTANAPTNTAPPSNTPSNEPTETPFPTMILTDTPNVSLTAHAEMDFTSTRIAEQTRIFESALKTQTVPSQTPNPTSIYTAQINVESANLRSGPGTQYSIVTGLSKGTILTIIARSSDWYLVDLPDSHTNAWIWSKIVTISGNNPNNIGIAVTIPVAPVVVTQPATPNAKKSGPRIISVRLEGTCSLFYFLITWEVPGGSGKELRFNTRTGVASLPVSGGSGTTRWDNNWWCGGGSGCSGSFVLEDWDGNVSPAVRSNVCQP